MIKKSRSEKDTTIVACDFCEALFHMDKAELEIAIERQLDILCNDCAKKLVSTSTEHAEYEGLSSQGKSPTPQKKEFVTVTCGVCGNSVHISMLEFRLAAERDLAILTICTQCNRGHSTVEPD